MSDWATRYPWAEHCAREPDEVFAHVGRPRLEWGPGPWQDEPDLVRWTTAAGPRGLIWRAPVTGSLCGYAEVTREHPFFSKQWRQLETPIEAHGGLTFAGTFDPESLRTEVGQLGGDWLDSWWLGFDCGHCFDMMPALDAVLRDLRSPRHWARYAAERRNPPPPLPGDSLGGHYWTIEEVHDEVEALALQLVAAANPEVRALLDAVRAEHEVDE